MTEFKNCNRCYFPDADWVEGVDYSYKENTNHSMNNIDSTSDMNAISDENRNKTDDEDENEDNESHIDEDYNDSNRIGNILYEHNPANEITII